MDLLGLASAQQAAHHDKQQEEVAAEHLLTIKQEQRTIRQHRLAAAKAAADTSTTSTTSTTTTTTTDWTTTYRHFDDWEDPEELAAEAAALAKKRKEKSERQPTSCNHDHTEERKVYEMEWGERLLQCQEFQCEGNAFYSEGQYERASVRYHHAITYFEYAIPDNDAQQDELDKTRLPVYQNFAACMLKLDKLDEAMNYCLQSLRIDPNCVKALYRQAQVLRRKDQLEEAHRVIKQAIAMDQQNVGPGDEGGDEGGTGDSGRRKYNAALVVERGKIRQKIASYKRNSQKMGAKMFRFGGEKEDSVAKSVSLEYVAIC